MVVTMHINSTHVHVTPLLPTPHTPFPRCGWGTPCSKRCSALSGARIYKTRTRWTQVDSRSLSHMASSLKWRGGQRLTEGGSRVPSDHDSLRHDCAPPLVDLSVFDLAIRINGIHVHPDAREGGTEGRRRGPSEEASAIGQVVEEVAI